MCNQCRCLRLLSGWLPVSDRSSNVTWITAVQLLIVVVTGAMMQMLIGPMLTLHLFNRKLERLAGE